MIVVDGGGKQSYFDHADVVVVQTRRPGNPDGFLDDCEAVLTLRTPHTFVYLNAEQWTKYRRWVRENSDNVGVVKE